jgi:putative intracellular protease/amidase
MTMTRRELGALLAAAGLLPLRGQAAMAEGEAAHDQTHVHDMSQFPPNWMGSEKIAFLIYPQFTALDVVGPHYMLASLMGSKTYLVAKTREPVESDLKLAIVPSATFEECPADLDIICVPGGTNGTLAAMEDEATIAFLKDRGSRAKLVTSVCTGSLVLGAAGLLDGYKATSHWAVRDVLREFGAEPVDARVVVDRNRITGAGVTAGLDFGLQILAKLRDQQYAEGVQLLAEYAPEPPFAAGTPATAPKASVDLMTGMLVQFVDNARTVAKRTVADRKG